MVLEWKSDWRAFVALLSDEIKNGATAERLKTLFGGKTVIWSGVIREKQLDDIAPLLTIELPEVQIDLGPFGRQSLSRQSVPASREALAMWERIPIGAEVTFSAVIGKQRSLLPPIELIHLSSGRTVLMIRLSEARPL